MAKSTTSAHRINWPHSLIIGLLALLWLMCYYSDARAQDSRGFVSIVGAQESYRFLAEVVERFGETTIFKYPLIEATGESAGLTMFCQGLGVQLPDIVMLNRRLTLEEYARCMQNGVGDIVELPLGYEAVVIVSNPEAPQLDLSLGQLFLALAATVPDPSNPQSMAANRYRNWQNIHSLLPDLPIEILGPPLWGSMARLLTHLGLRAGCQTLPSVQALAEANPAQYLEICNTLREDEEQYRPVSLDDEALLELLAEEPHRIALVTYGFLSQNQDQLRHIMVESVPPARPPIAEGRYPLARPLYVYLKRGHLQLIPGLREFAEKLTARTSIGSHGYLMPLGLVPLEVDKYEALTQVVELMTPMEAPTPEVAPPEAVEGENPEEAPPEDPALILDLAAWERIKDSNSIALLQLYLEKFSDGNFVTLAQQKVEELQAAEAEAQEAAEAVEALESAASDENTSQ